MVTKKNLIQQNYGPKIVSPQNIPKKMLEQAGAELCQAQGKFDLFWPW